MFLNTSWLYQYKRCTFIHPLLQTQLKALVVGWLINPYIYNNNILVLKKMVQNKIQLKPSSNLHATELADDNILPT